MKEFNDNDADWKKLSTALNASAKIYGYRVDGYGIDMYKMVGVFNRAQMNKDDEKNKKSNKKGKEVL